MSRFSGSKRYEYEARAGLRCSMKAKAVRCAVAFRVSVQVKTTSGLAVRLQHATPPKTASAPKRRSKRERCCRGRSATASLGPILQSFVLATDLAGGVRATHPGRFSHPQSQQEASWRNVSGWQDPREHMTITYDSVTFVGLGFHASGRGILNGRSRFYREILASPCCA